MIIESKVEVDPLHFTVGNEVGAGLELVLHGQADGVANCFIPIVGPKKLRLFRHVVAELRIPTGKRPTPDNRGRNWRQRVHASNLRPHEGLEQTRILAHVDAMQYFDLTLPTLAENLALDEAFLLEADAG